VFDAFAHALTNPLFHRGRVSDWADFGRPTAGINYARVDRRGAKGQSARPPRAPVIHRA